MSEQLARYFLEAPHERLLALNLEDVAMVQAWYTSHLDEPTMAESYQQIPVRIAAWLADKEWAPRVTEGARQQPVLRLCIDALTERGPANLHRDELDLLFFVYGLIHRSRARSQFQRPLDQIAPHLEAIVARREALPALRGLPNINRAVLVVTEEAIQEAPAREINRFGGLAEAFRGPVLVNSGAIKVIGDIPDGTAVVAERGTCYVSGYVLGRLLVGEHAEVQENIAGLLIAQRGNIRARGIVNRAQVIAKQGRIACGTAQSPDLVYAGLQLRLRESATMGTFIAPRIRVEGEVHGGTWHVTNLLRARHFVQGDRRPIDIVFRSAIGHEDFGEALPREAVTFARTAGRLQARVLYLEQLKKRQADEAEHYASTALLYICSGPAAAEELLQVDSLRRRRAFLLRLMMGLHLLTKSLMDVLQAHRVGEGKELADREAVQRAIQRSLAEVTRELGELKLEGNYPEELDREWEELLALYGETSGSGVDYALSRAIRRFHESRKQWQEEVLELEEKIAIMAARLAADESRRALIQRAQAAGTSQPVLLQIVKAARQRGTEDPVVKRLETPFVRRMLGLLKKRNEWVERYGREAAERATELAAVHRKLRETYHYDMAASHPDPRAEGQFSFGVRIHVEELVAADPAGAQTVIFATPDTGGAMAAYGLREGAVVPVPLEAE